MEIKKPIRSFRDLEVYKNSYNACVILMTKRPKATKQSWDLNKSRISTGLKFRSALNSSQSTTLHRDNYSTLPLRGIRLKTNIKQSPSAIQASTPKPLIYNHSKHRLLYIQKQFFYFQIRGGKQI